MKKTLLIKLNNIVVDTKACQDRAIKKSVEFFLGMMVDMKELNEFRESLKKASCKECINLFLNDKGIFLRENAIIKKYMEYYKGREFDGFIREASLLVDKKKLKRLSESHKLMLLSLMPQEDTDFLAASLGMAKICRIISSNSVSEGLNEAKKQLKSNFTYLGDSITDYEAAVRNNVDFLGFRMDESELGQIKVINKIDEMLV